MVLSHLISLNNSYLIHKLPGTYLFQLGNLEFEKWLCKLRRQYDSNILLQNLDIQKLCVQKIYRNFW